MKTKISKKHMHFHQRLERFMRHKVSIFMISALTLIAAATFDNRVRNVMQFAYSQGWGWVGTYLHHEHPTHYHHPYSFTRTVTISGPGPS
jgi:hypothetical protein